MALVRRPLITPVLDLMQTVPIFAYLVPVLLALRILGPVAAIIGHHHLCHAADGADRGAVAPVQVPERDASSLGRMAGCTLPWQMT